MMPAFEPIPANVNFPMMEEKVLLRWGQDNTFQKVEEIRKTSPLFIFYEGPPTANGSPGIHHVISRAFKDVIIRYKTMKGFRPLRRSGWDTHGLPVELEVEKELGLNSKQEIENFGIEEFNRRCKESVLRYVQEWKSLTERSGVWLDMDDGYVTYHNSYIESGWWIFKQLWEKNLLYEGYKVTPHCPRCVTSLSSHEVALGYEEGTPDPSVFIRFKLTENQPLLNATGTGILEKLRLTVTPQGEPDHSPSFLAWTTTPWTLTAHTALAISPEDDYILVQGPAQSDNERLIIGKDTKKNLLDDTWKILSTFKGEELLNICYEPVFENPDLENHVYRVVPAAFVTLQEGTGIVHSAPAYGADDQELGQALGLPTIHTVDSHGILEGNFPGSGKFVKDADRDIILDLAARGKLFKQEVIHHTYPFCWRCGTALLYYAKASWYIRTTAVKQEMVAGNQQINWHPDHIKEGRFGEWLRNNVDWAISRERYWGTPIPIWRCNDCEHSLCIESAVELERLATTDSKSLCKNLDLHRPHVDRIHLSCPSCSGVMSRIPEVADAWFDSGAMPFAQWEYPTKLRGSQGQEIVLRGPQDLIASPFFPADYITEAVDQTRGWFYSLLALSTLITGQPSYKNVVCLGLILDEYGLKMSKSKGNAVDPWSVLTSQGADALRWYLFTSGSAGSNRRFSGNLVQESLRRFLLTLWNTYSFFVTYANLDNFVPDDHGNFWNGDAGDPTFASLPPNLLDRWAISELNHLVSRVTAEMDDYNPTTAAREIEEFVDSLSNWYVRRSRRRFWKSENDEDKLWAYATLYSCLSTLSRVIAPMAPFVADEIFRGLSRDSKSVHLSDFPVHDTSLIDPVLSQSVMLAMRISSLGRAARSRSNLKVRQPLSRLLVQTSGGDATFLSLVESQIMDELNVKGVEFAGEESLATFKVRPNLPILGPRFGNDVKEITALVREADPNVLAKLVKSGSLIQLGNFSLNPEDLLVGIEEIAGLAVASDSTGDLTIALDTNVTPDLEEEGFAREFIHRLQLLRRDSGLAIDDRINIYVSSRQTRIHAILETYESYILQETLGHKILFDQIKLGITTEELNINEIHLTVGIETIQRATFG